MVRVFAFWFDLSMPRCFYVQLFFGNVESVVALSLKEAFNFGAAKPVELYREIFVSVKCMTLIWRAVVSLGGILWRRAEEKVPARLLLLLIADSGRSVILCLLRWKGFQRGQLWYSFIFIPSFVFGFFASAYSELEFSKSCYFSWTFTVLGCWNQL